MNFPGFYSLKNVAHGFVADGTVKHHKDSVRIVKDAPFQGLGHFYIAQEPDGTFVIHSLVEKFTGAASGYTKRVITMINHNKVVSRPDVSKNVHRWKIIRDVTQPTHFHIVDVATMAYWRLSSGDTGTKVDLYYSIPEFLQNVERANAATTIPPGIAWEIIPVLPSGRYYIKNILYGDINVGAMDDKGNSPVIAASSPAVWHIVVVILPFPLTPSLSKPYGMIWDIFFVNPSSESSSSASSNDDDDSDKDSDDDTDDDDDAESPVNVVDSKLVVPEAAGSAQHHWDPVWSAKDGAWRIKDKENSQHEWTLANKYRDGASDQAHVLCSDEKSGCGLWELVFIGE